MTAISNARKVLLTRPKNLFYEKYVFTCYMEILTYLKYNLESHASLEADLELLADPNSGMSFERRMALIYRSEKKKILRS